MTIFFASQNQGKIAEAVKLFAEQGHELLTLNDREILLKQGIIIPDDFVVAETGQTLTDNALIKAQTFAQLTGLPTLADDSGLLLEAFPGFPGVASNRWFVGTDAERNQALLEKLQNKNNRRAKFQTVLALFNPKTKLNQFFNGEVTGVIAQEVKGTAGFGYDPLFIPDNYQETFAQLGLPIKNKISHRARAWSLFADYLSQLS